MSDVAKQEEECWPMCYLDSCENVGHITNKEDSSVLRNLLSSDMKIINETWPTDSNNFKGVFLDTEDSMWNTSVC